MRVRVSSRDLGGNMDTNERFGTCPRCGAIVSLDNTKNNLCDECYAKERDDYE